MSSDNLATSLVAAALSVVLISNIIDQRRVNGELEKALSAQQMTLEGNKKVEVQLDGLAKGLQKLAQGGNPNAQRIVETLRQNGVNINDNAAAR